MLCCKKIILIRGVLYISFQRKMFFRLFMSVGQTGDSISHGDSGIFLCPTLSTKLSLPGSKLTISLISIYTFPFSCNFILTIKPLGKPLSKTGGGSCSLDPSILNIFPIVTGDNSPYIYWPAGFALIPTRASPEKQGPSALKSSFPWQSCPISRRPLKVNSVGIPVASEIVRLKKINEERC